MYDGIYFFQDIENESGKIEAGSWDGAWARMCIRINHPQNPNSVTSVQIFLVLVKDIIISDVLLV